MSHQNWIDPNHPHGPPDPRWITDDGTCLLCADSYHKGKITKLESQLTAKTERIATLEQALREAKNVCVFVENIGGFGFELHRLARNALATISAVLKDEKEGK